MNVGSLFSGIGGFDLGLERAGFTIIWQVEHDAYCQKVLRKHWPAVPCHHDITTIQWRDIPSVDLVCGGFPCQPFSVAGQQKGQADDRYLWPEVVRCLATLRPAWFLGENVPGLIHLALDQVCTDLESLGYQVWPVCVPACAVDAPHIRQRIWIVAYHKDKRVRRRKQQSEGSKGEGHVADANGLQIDRQRSGGFQSIAPQYSRWPVEPAVGRVADGIPRRLDRLKGLGNAVVPQIVEALGRMILQVQKDNDAPPLDRTGFQGL